MKEDFRILFLINKFKRGGAERAFANQINELYICGYDVYLGLIYDFAPNNSYLSELKISEDKIKNFSFRSLFDFKKLFFLRKFIIEHDIDIVYSTLESANIISRLLKMFFPKLKIKVIIRESGMADRKKYRHKILDLGLNFFSDKIIAVSFEVKESLLRYQKIHGKKIDVLENGVLIKPWDEVEKRRSSLKRDKKEIFTAISVGSMNNANKSQMEILRIFKEMENNRLLKNYLLVLVGDGILKDKYVDFVKSNNLENKVLFTGYLKTEELEKYYLSADLFILYSENEGCPNVVLEAMSLGIPVISTRVGGVSNIIEDGKSGFLIERNDADRVMELILNLAKDVKLRNEMAYNAHRRADENYSIQKKIQELISLFYGLNG